MINLLVKIFIVLFFFLTVGCSHTLTIPKSLPTINTSELQAYSTNRKSISLIIPPTFENYTFTKSAYNWAGGNLFPDTITFEIGKNLSKEIEEQCNKFFNVTTIKSEVSQVINKSPENIGAIIVPEIIDCSLNLPKVRFSNINAEIKVNYSLYANTKLITSEPVIGKGQKRLGATKQNYVIALKNAKDDLLLKTEEVLKKFQSLPLNITTTQKKITSRHNKAASKDSLENLTQELKKLEEMKSNNLINNEEYIKLKTKIINKY